MSSYIDILNDNEAAWGEWEEYATLTGGAAYEWDDFYVMYSPDGRLCYGGVSGCSCNDRDDYHPSDIMQPAETLFQIVNAALQWGRGYDCDMDAALGLASRITREHPPLWKDVRA